MKTVKAVKGQLTKAEDHEERDVDDELPDRGADDDLTVVGRVHLPGRPQPFKTNNPWSGILDMGRTENTHAIF